MMLDPLSDHRPPATGQRRFSEDVWACARDDYARGCSGPDVCDRYDIPLSTFRARAAREGWRRGDLAPPAKLWQERPPIDDADLETDACRLSEIAWRHAARAVMEGDRQAARTWTRLSRELLEVYREDAARREAFSDAVEDRIAQAEDDLAEAGLDPDAVEVAIPPARLASGVPITRDDLRMARMFALADALKALPGGDLDQDDLDDLDCVFRPPESSSSPPLASDPAPPL